MQLVQPPGQSRTIFWTSPSRMPLTYYFLGPLIVATSPTRPRHYWMLETDMVTHSIQTIYTGPCLLRPPIQPEKYGFVNAFLKWRDVNITNIELVLLMMVLKWRDHTLQEPMPLPSRPKRYQFKWAFSSEAI